MGILSAIAIAGMIFTFDIDSGPNKTTEKILNVLKKNKVRAVFCLVGNTLNNRKSKRLVKRMVREGHTLCNHSQTHRSPRYLNSWQKVWEIKKSQKIISQVSGVVPKFYRAPSCQKTHLQLKYIRALGIKYLPCQVDSGDWRKQYGISTYWRIVNQYKAGKRGVLVLHNKYSTYLILQRLIDKLKSYITYSSSNLRISLGVGKTPSLQIRF